MISARKPSHVGGAIYGGIVMLATVGALSEDDAIGPGRMLFITLTTSIVFWVAHAFSETIELRATAEQTLPLRAGLPILLIFVNIPNGQLIYSILGLVIFAGFTMFDFRRLRNTSDIKAAPLLAASIFLDILNVFMLLLSIFGRR